MEIVNFPTQYSQIGARGVCPHCSFKSYFKPVGTYQEQLPDNRGTNMASSAQCESCKKFVLVIGWHGVGQQSFNLQHVYPLGKPNDDVAQEVPTDIRSDFSEALRCKWINAYKACVVMCRRSIQASVIALGAPDDTLVKQIDTLFKAGKITEPLKDFAHEIRLTGNDGAHPDKDGLKDVVEKDADDIIEFTKEYLHHVYVMPAKLAARKPAKPAPPVVP